MKTFTVEKEVALTSKCYTVASDGERIGDWWEKDPDIEITIGFSVHAYEDNEHISTKFYPVDTNMLSLTNNEREVLEKIKADFPPSEYENLDW